MPARKIFAVGYEFPGGEVEQIPYDSDRSLLDADVILFEPSLQYYSQGDWYQGKPSLSDHASFSVRRHAAHWSSEIKDAFEAGKTVIIFLAKPKEVYVDTGERRHSGTGRNRQTTRVVSEYSSYKAIPLTIKVQARSGQEISPVGDLNYLAPYWKEFAELSPYEATIEAEFTEQLLKTKSGGRTVGASIRSGRGTLLLLPPIRYDEDSFTNYGDDKEPDTWNERSQVFGRKLASAILELDKALRSESEETPTPNWAQTDSYRLPEEAEIEAKIAKKLKQIASAQEQRRKLERSLREAGKLRGLLFERGKQLEGSVLEALRLMGFSTKNLTAGESEFDAVFVSEEGRFLGEVEGKDNRAINIDKLSQLERNLQEDFARDDVDHYAQGVLFGNAFRLTAVEDRADFFTEKCQSGAARSRIALVRTPDLFPPARYLGEINNKAYAKSCRVAIQGAAGSVVVFPSPPTHEHDPVDTVED